jgi:hypothetical protein
LASFFVIYQKRIILFLVNKSVLLFISKKILLLQICMTDLCGATTCWLSFMLNWLSFIMGWVLMSKLLTSKVKIDFFQNLKGWNDVEWWDSQPLNPDWLCGPFAGCTACGSNQSPRWSTRLMRQSGLVKDLLHVLFKWCNLRE